MSQGWRVADFGGDPEDVQNANGAGLYKRVTLTWSRPRIWNRDEAAPIDLAEYAPGYVYVIVRDHHRASFKENIVYVGITNNLSYRFDNHPKAKQFVTMRGTTALSVADIDFHNYRTALNNNRRALEEIEHILIWTLWPSLYNERKMYTLPGMGRHAGRAWHITNAGHRFAGRMPREIVYPWILIKPGRDRSAKQG